MIPGAATLAAVGLVLPLAAAPASLADARRQEVQTLRAERDALTAAVSEADAAARTARQAVEDEITTLTETLTRLQADNAAHERSLPTRERARAIEVQDRRLHELTAQMRMLAADAEGSPSSEAATPEALPALAAAIVAQLERSGSLRVEHGAAYFGTDGAAYTGDVLRVGEVAAARWDGTPTPIIVAPAGLMAVPGVTPQDVETADGHVVTVVLHDPREPPEPDAYLAATWQTTMKTGGPLMWVLLVFAIVSLLIAIERAAVIGWIAAAWTRAVRRLEPLASPSSDLGEEARAAALAAETSFVAAPLLAVLAPGDANPEIVEDRATQGMLTLRERLTSRLSVLGLAAAVAPLTGLLGTVSGMITTFSVVTTKGTSDPQLLAGGISEALLTTQFGLAIAIPALIVHALLSRGARRVLASAEQTVLRHIHGHEGHDHDHHHHQQHPRQHPRPHSGRHRAVATHGDDAAHGDEASRLRGTSRSGDE